jgi:hypothetical protein
MYHNNVTNLIHFHFHNHFIVSWSSTCFVPQPAAAKSYSARNSHQKTASVVPPEDGRLTPETCIGSRHNKVIVKVKVY